jgi:hypothetical protein
VLSVLLVYTDSDYPFVIFKLFFILLSKLCLVYLYDLTLVFCSHFNLLVHRTSVIIHLLNNVVVNVGQTIKLAINTKA